MVRSSSEWRTISLHVSAQFYYCSRAVREGIQNNYTDPLMCAFCVAFISVFRVSSDLIPRFVDPSVNVTEIL